MYKQIVLATALLAGSMNMQAQSDINIGKSKIQLQSKLMTPEALWAMGRIGGAQASPNGKQIVYQVGYYSVKENKGHQVLYIMDSNGKNVRQLTTSAKNETDASWIEGGKRIAYLFEGQVWSMNPDGTERKQLTKSTTDIEGYKFSPDGKHIILIKSLPYHGSIKENPSDLPKATGRLVTDMNYRHWDHYVESIQHPFIADVTENGITDGVDILANEPYECPLAPFGGIEQLDWSKDSQCIAYRTARELHRLRVLIPHIQQAGEPVHCAAGHRSPNRRGSCPHLGRHQLRHRHHKRLQDDGV